MSVLVEVGQDFSSLLTDEIIAIFEERFKGIPRMVLPGTRSRAEFDLEDDERRFAVAHFRTTKQPSPLCSPMSLVSVEVRDISWREAFAESGCAPIESQRSRPISPHPFTDIVAIPEAKRGRSMALGRRTLKPRPAFTGVLAESVAGA